jgi:hypothetical protein
LTRSGPASRHPGGTGHDAVRFLDQLLLAPRYCRNAPALVAEPRLRWAFQTRESGRGKLASAILPTVRPG